VLQVNINKPISYFICCVWQMEIVITLLVLQQWPNCTISADFNGDCRKLTNQTNIHDQRNYITPKLEICWFDKTDGKIYLCRWKGRNALHSCCFREASTHG